MRPWSSTGLVLVGLMVLANRQASAAGVEVDAAVKPYEPVSGIAGNLSSIGSDTLNNLMTFWAEGFRKRYPNVNVQIEGKGSATAPRGHAFASVFLISSLPVRSIGPHFGGPTKRRIRGTLTENYSSPNQALTRAWIMVVASRGSPDKKAGPRSQGPEARWR